MSVANSRRSNNTTIIQRRSTQQEIADKKLEEDEYMSAAIGDLQWLKQSLKSRRRKIQEISYDKNGLASVHLAALHGRYDCLVWLLQNHSVLIDSPSRVGSWTPLHLCISNSTGRRSYECLQMLLLRGANPNSKNDDDITPLHQAASEGNIQCLKALIAAGSDVNAEDHRGHKPIDLAKLWSRRTCARILATEQWHKDKNSLSNQLKHLKRIDTSTALEINYNETLIEKIKENPILLEEFKREMNREKTPQPVNGNQKCKQNISTKSKADYIRFNNITLWNKSTKAIFPTYVENLKDYYPRDEYTKLPKPPATRHDSPVLHSFYDPQIAAESNYKKVNFTKIPRYPKKPRLNIVINQRPQGPSVVFKPKHIADVNKRKHYEDDELGQRSEIGLHLAQTVESCLFRNAMIDSAVSTPDNVNSLLSLADVDLSRIHKPQLLHVFH